MKLSKHLLLLCIMLILSNCAGTLHTAYNGDEDYDEDKQVIIVTNNLQQPAAPRLREEPGMFAQRLNPGQTHQWTIKRQRTITIVGETYETNGWSDERLLAPIKRNAFLHDTIFVDLNNLLLQNIVMQKGVVINNTSWTIIVTDDQGNNYGEIPPDHISWPQEVAPGPINFFWRKKDSSRTIRIKGVIDQDKNDIVVRGQTYDWKVSCRRH
jgi:hypothetical protein